MSKFQNFIDNDLSSISEYKSIEDFIMKNKDKLEAIHQEISPTMKKRREEFLKKMNDRINSKK